MSANKAVQHKNLEENISVDIDAMIRSIMPEFPVRAGFFNGAEVENLAFALSHELRTPLRQLSAFTELLKRRLGPDLPPGAEDLVAQVVTGAAQMHDMIDGLTEYCRILDTQIRDYVCLAECVAQVCDRLSKREDWPSPIIRGVEELPTVRGDSAQIAMVFEQLITNAVQYRGEAPAEIDIHGLRRGPIWWRLSVTDNGIGIDPKFADDIFRVFRRLHPADSSSSTGLGLATCRRIVSLHGGQIFLDTDHTPGARFVFDLPA